jgi:hypothetical protein
MPLGKEIPFLFPLQREAGFNQKKAGNLLNRLAGTEDYYRCGVAESGRQVATLFDDVDIVLTRHGS